MHCSSYKNPFPHNFYSFFRTNSSNSRPEFLFCFSKESDSCDLNLVLHLKCIKPILYFWFHYTFKYFSLYEILLFWAFDKTFLTGNIWFNNLNVIEFNNFYFISNWITINRYKQKVWTQQKNWIYYGFRYKILKNFCGEEYYLNFWFRFGFEMSFWFTIL